MLFGVLIEMIVFSGSEYYYRNILKFKLFCSEFLLYGFCVMWEF